MRDRSVTQTFAITTEDQQKINAWIKEQYAVIVKAQIGSEFEKWHSTDENGITYPYFGTIGGELTYQFTGTSLGTVTKVFFCKGTNYEAELDLTDYNSW